MIKLSLSGEAKKHVQKWGGTYFLNEKTTNGKPFWVHKSGFSVIYWNNNNFWSIEYEKNLGKNRGYITGPANDERVPIEISEGWTYAKDGVFINATRNVVHFEEWAYNPGKFNSYS